MEKITDLWPDYMVRSWSYYLLSICLLLNDGQLLSLFNPSELSVYLEVSVFWEICFCCMALGLSKTTAPQKRRCLHHFGFLFLINNSVISKGG